MILQRRGANIPATVSTAAAEIELAVLPLGNDDYQLDLRISDPGSEAAIEPVRGLAKLSAASLKLVENDFAAYGQALSAMVFADANLTRAWQDARIALDRASLPIRLRLLLPPGCAALHEFRWELLTEPGGTTPLSTSPRIHFSRFLFSRDWRPVRLRSGQNITTLIAVANPTDLSSTFGLGAIDAPAFIDPIAAKLPHTILPAPVTLAALVDALKASPDIVYIVCHGTIDPDQGAQLFLANDRNETELVAASRLAAEIERLPQPPRLVVLASCQSAGFGEASTHSLAAQLSQSGVPAIVAMQGLISMTSMNQAMPVFFTELLKDGQIDRALAEARHAIIERKDAWMPNLLLRLKSGRIWYEPGFRTRGDTARFWGELCIQIRTDRALPIVGPELASAVLGDSSAIANAIAASEGFPLTQADRNDLAKVTQFLSISKGLQYAQSLVLKQYIANIHARHPEIPQDKPFPDILAQVATLQQNDPAAPMRILANLPLSNYVNASCNGLLLHSLKVAGKQPVDKLAKWRPSERVPSPMASVIDQEDLSVAQPLLFGLFGDCEVPLHWVLTEDDFFDYTVRASQYKLIPAHITKLFCRHSLLFLGFDLDSWMFRALFRMIMNQEGIALQQGKAHIGVQLDPEDKRFANPERARQYLIDYYNSAGRGRGGEPQIDVYWGSSTDFLCELARELEARKNDPLPLQSTRGDDD